MHFQYLLLLTVPIGFSITHAQQSSSISSAYGILYCDTGPNPKAATLQTLLPKFQSLLRLVQADAQNAAESQAFHAFFKSLSNAAYVRGVFKHMADGRPAMIPGEGDADLRNLEKPNLVCLSPSMPGYGALKQQCGPTSIATTRRNRAFVILCDPFWQLNEQPESLDCPVVRRNVFVQNLDDRILHNQFAAFVHEMAHAYTMSWTSVEQATEGIMDCVNLNPRASVKNVQSYALYAAMVVAGCNRYPSPHVFHGERRNVQASSLEHQPRLSIASSDTNMSIEDSTEKADGLDATTAEIPPDIES